MTSKINISEYMRADEVMRGGTPCSFREEVGRKTRIARDKWWYSRDILINTFHYTPEEIDSVEASEPEWHRQGRYWNELADTSL